MSTDADRLSPDASHPLGRFEIGLRDLIDDGLILSLDSTGDELEQGLYCVTLCDRTTAEVDFDFTEFDDNGEQTMLCHWARWGLGRKVIDQGPPGERFGTWDEGATWLRQAAEMAAESADILGVSKG